MGRREPFEHGIAIRPARDRSIGGDYADAPGRAQTNRRGSSWIDHTKDGKSISAAQMVIGRRGRSVAGDYQKFDVAQGKIVGDLCRKMANFTLKSRPVRTPCQVSQVDRRFLWKLLMEGTEHCKAPDTRVENADGTIIRQSLLFLVPARLHMRDTRQMHRELES